MLFTTLHITYSDSSTKKVLGMSLCSTDYPENAKRSISSHFKEIPLSSTRLCTVTLCCPEHFFFNYLNISGLTTLFSWAAINHLQLSSGMQRHPGRVRKTSNTLHIQNLSYIMNLPFAFCFLSSSIQLFQEMTQNQAEKQHIVSI